LIYGFAVIMIVTELYGIKLVVAPQDTASLGALAATIVASLTLGIARAWELIGAPSRGMSASLHDLVGLDSTEDKAT
jgi:hypothetical protein